METKERQQLLAKSKTEAAGVQVFLYYHTAYL